MDVGKWCGPYDVRNLFYKYKIHYDVSCTPHDDRPLLDAVRRHEAVDVVRVAAHEGFHGLCGVGGEHEESA